MLEEIHIDLLHNLGPVRRIRERFPLHRVAAQERNASAGQHSFTGGRGRAHSNQHGGHGWKRKAVAQRTLRKVSTSGFISSIAEIAVFFSGAREAGASSICEVSPCRQAERTSSPLPRACASGNTRRAIALVQNVERALAARQSAPHPVSTSFHPRSRRSHPGTAPSRRPAPAQGI